MATTTYDYTGTNGTLPAGVTQIAPTVQIQSNALDFAAASNVSAAATHTAYSWTSFPRQWMQWDFIPANDSNCSLIPITNAAYSDLIFVVLDTPDDQVTIETEGSLLAAAAITLTSGVMYRVRADINYGTSGTIRVWVWRPGTDPDPAYASPTLIYNGDNTVTTPVAEVVAIAVNTTAGATAATFDNLIIHNSDPGWWTLPPYVTQSATAALTASASPSLTFATAPAEGDVVVMFPSSTGITVTLNTVSGWENILGGTTDVESDSHQMCGVAHRVTAAEAAGSTVTFTATSLFTVAQTGNVVGCVVRGVDRVTMFAGSGSTFNSGNTITPHVLASFTPTVTGSLVLSCVTKDATGTYTTPTGWRQLATSNTNQGKWLGQRDALAVNGTSVAATNITPSAGDEYASISVAMRAVTVSPPRRRTPFYVPVAKRRAA